MADRLGLSFEPRAASTLDVDYSAVTHAGQWALEISDQIGASTYVNPPGGRKLFHPEEWRARNIALFFTPDAAFDYPVAPRFAFRRHLSILDCMMWVDPDRVREALDDMAPGPV